MSVAKAPQHVLHADDSTFRDTVLGSDVPVLVDFYADWCGPCRRLAPMLEELASGNPGIRVVKINVDHSPRVSATYGIEAIPSLMLFKDGVVAQQVVGLPSKGQLLAMLNHG